MDAKIHPAAGEYLRRYVDVTDTLAHPEQLDGMIVRATPVPRALMESAPRLKVIGRHGVGYEKVDVAAARELGIRVLNTPTSNADSVAEMIVARFLEMSRRLYEANRGVREGRYQKNTPSELIGTEISGKTLGLIGIGNIPQRVNRMMRAAFGVRTLGYDPFAPERQFAENGIERVDTLEALLERADLVTVSVHLTPETANLISGEVFSHFRPGAILVNTARGGIVNEADLYDALCAGRLRAAAFDVFEKEPCPVSNRLLTLENFSATPHIGGNTEQALYRTGLTIAENVVRCLRGERAEGVVV